LPSDETRTALNASLIRVRLKTAPRQAVTKEPNAQPPVNIRKTAPIMPARLDWPSAIGNFLLNFGTLDLMLLDCLESQLPPDEFEKVKTWHFRDRIERLKKQLAPPADPGGVLLEIEDLFSRIDRMRELRNHLAHGTMRLNMAADQSWEVTVTLPHDLTGGCSLDARHVSFKELESAIQELPKLIEDFKKVASNR
jgi:hypothetical protein